MMGLGWWIAVVAAVLALAAIVINARKAPRTA
jgi:hypothetical protein